MLGKYWGYLQKMNESNALYEKIFTTIVVVIGLAIYECR